MITMKKFFWVTIITLSMSLTLSGCGSSSNGKSQTTSATKVPANNQNTSKSEPTKVDNSTPNPTKEVAVTTEPTVEDIDPVAQNLIDLIKTIGTVELDDEALISKINTRYSQMTEKQKNQVYNYIDVINAEDELELLKSNGLESMINNIKGVYKQTNYENNENYYSVAYITDNEIKVYWAYNNGKILSLYWTGTFEKPNNVLDNYTWVSRKNKVEAQYCPRSSIDDTKEFTFSQGVLSYSGSYGNYENFVMKLEHSNVDFSANDETKISNKNASLSFCGMTITPTDVYAQGYVDKTEVWYYAPKSMLQIRKNEDSYLNSVATTSSVFWDGMKSSYKNNDYDLVLEETIQINGTTTKLLGFNYTSYNCKLNTQYLTAYYEKSTNSLIVIGIACGQKTEYDYLADFKNMLKTVK